MLRPGFDGIEVSFDLVADPGNVGVLALPAALTDRPDLAVVTTDPTVIGDLVAKASQPPLLIFEVVPALVTEIERFGVLATQGPAALMAIVTFSDYRLTERDSHGTTGCNL